MFDQASKSLFNAISMHEEHMGGKAATPERNQSMMDSMKRAHGLYSVIASTTPAAKKGAAMLSPSNLAVMAKIKKGL